MNSTKTPLAVGLFASILYVACALAVWIFPVLTRLAYQNWFHGVDLSTIWNPGISLDGSSLIVGLVSVFIVSYIATWVFVVLHKAIAGK